MTRRIHGALFGSEEELRAGCRACLELGMELVEAYTPYAVHGLDKVIGFPPTRLPWVCFAGGLAGVSGGLFFEYWATATDWPLNVGGKPFDSLPAFVPVGFEMLVLFAGLATAFGLWLRSGLLPGRAPRRALPRVTDDRFGLIVAHRDGSVEPARVREALLASGAQETWEELEG